MANKIYTERLLESAVEEDEINGYRMDPDLSTDGRSTASPWEEGNCKPKRSHQCNDCVR